MWTLGTSAVKLLLMEESGKICNIVSKEYPLFFPHPGWSEQNPEDWFTQSVEGMKELTEGIDRSQVAGIGFGGQMHGLVTLDENDKVIRPAILWNDGRSQKETEYLNNEIGKDKLSAVHSKHCFCRLYSTEDPVDEEKRAGEICKDRKDHASKRLPCIQTFRIFLHRCF